MGGVLAIVIAIVFISAVVGGIAQVLNRLNEPPPPPRRRPTGGPRQAQADRDMDRFLAEIDRLRKKNNPPADDTQAATAAPPAAAPVARPVRPPERDRGRPRVVAELAEPRTRPVRDRIGPPAPTAAPALPSMRPSAEPVEDLPVATVVGPATAPTAPSAVPVVRVATLPPRGRPAPKTDLAKNLTGLLGTGQGVAMAVVLQEILGPPKAKKR